MIPLYVIVLTSCVVGILMVIAARLGAPIVGSLDSRIAEAKQAWLELKTALRRIKDLK